VKIVGCDLEVFKPSLGYDKWIRDCSAYLSAPPPPHYEETGFGSNWGSLFKPVRKVGRPSITASKNTHSGMTYFQYYYFLNIIS
jgi:hypothetical protein